MELLGKVAVVTGSGNGIGKAVALALSNAGAQVVITDIDISAARNVGEQITASGGKCLVVEADVTIAEQVEHLFAEVAAHFGAIDILINNVGFTIRKPFIDFSELEWDRVINTNLKSVFLCSRLAGRSMLTKKSGVVIHISSIHGLGGVSKRSPYATAKSAINSLTQTMACEWAVDGVRVNAIAPGYILTDSLKEAFRVGSLSSEDMLRRTPQGKLGTPEDIANAVLFLASDRASFITGVTLYVDGGYSAYHGPEIEPSFSHNLNVSQ